MLTIDDRRTDTTGTFAVLKVGSLFYYCGKLYMKVHQKDGIRYWGACLSEDGCGNLSEFNAESLISEVTRAKLIVER